MLCWKKTYYSLSSVDNSFAVSPESQKKVIIFLITFFKWSDCFWDTLWISMVDYWQDKWIRLLVDFEGNFERGGGGQFDYLINY